MCVDLNFNFVLVPIYVAFKMARLGDCDGDCDDDEKRCMAIHKIHGDGRTRAKDP